MRKSFLTAIVMSVAGVLSGGVCSFFGYDNCIELKNSHTRAVIAAYGGRLLEYSFDGRNILYLDNTQAGWDFPDGSKQVDPSGGRFDIGPEITIPRHRLLWEKKWQLHKMSRTIAIAVSQPDPRTGVQLTRIFELSEHDSRLSVTQIMANISSTPVQWNFWGRILTIPGGVCVIPREGISRYPAGYYSYHRGTLLMRPQDKAVEITGKYAVIHPFPVDPKLSFDSLSGKLHYFAPNNLLLTITYPVFPERRYNNESGMTACIFYCRDFCELEPIGPNEEVLPGGKNSFTIILELKDKIFPGAKKVPGKYTENL